MTVHVSSNKTIAKNTLFLYTRMVIVLVVSLFTTRVVLNALGAMASDNAKEYGENK